LLSLAVEDVDLENRRAVVGSKGGDIELPHFQRSEAVAPPESAGILVRWLQLDSWANPITTLGFTGPCRRSSKSVPSLSLHRARCLVEWEDLEIGVFNCAATVYAIEDRCSHDNGTLVEGVLDQDERTIECPPLGSLFDLKTGRPKSLPAYVPVDTFPVIIDEEMIKLEVE
jgi:3-phenylpropionate/trans-cinnamate dioxygenase ferredoxin component